MALIRGSNGTIMKGTAEVAYMKSWSLNSTMGTESVRTYDSDGEYSLANILSWSFSCEGYLSDGDTLGQAALETAHRAGTVLTDLKFLVNGSITYETDTSDTDAGMIIETFNVSHDVGSIVAFSMTVKGSGLYKKTTV